VDNFSLGRPDNISFEIDHAVNFHMDHSDAGQIQNMIRLFDRYKIDIIFNLAVMPLPHSLRFAKVNFDVNTGIVSTLCELLREGLYEKLIHFSSSEVYGSKQKEIPMDESHPLGPSTPYAASKAAGDLLALSYHRTFGLDIRIVRPFNNYGPRQNDGSYAGIIPLTIKRLLNGERAIIYGDGNQTRDYTHVEDTCRAALDIAENDQCRGKVINVASGKEMPVLDLITMIQDCMEERGIKVGRQIRLLPPRPGDVRRHIANIYLAEDLIGFKSEVEFNAGLSRTIEWYLERAVK
jgi:UDP-glucose 4-epimerase